MVPGFVSRNHWFREEDITLIFLSNIDNAAFRQILRDLSAIVFGEPYEVPVSRKVAKLSIDQLKSFEGMYSVSPYIYFSIFMDSGGLFFRYKVQWRTHVLIPESDSTLFHPTDFARLQFVKGSNGKISGLYCDNGSKFPLWGSTQPVWVKRTSNAFK